MHLSGASPMKFNQNTTAGYQKRQTLTGLPLNSYDSIKIN